MEHYALSLKQPWAALLAHGLKTVEVRRWATAYTGRLLIHAARVHDRRPEAWALVPPELREFARLGGGIVGAATLTGCVRYASAEAFAADRPRHLNEPSWWEPAGLFVFVFADAEALPFRRVPGNVRLFRVEGEAPAAPVRRFRRLRGELGAGP